MVVTHPLERIVSAYVDKLKSGSDIPWQRHLGKVILTALQKDLPPKQIASGKGVLFQEFIWYIITYDYKNGHWAPIQELCQPCKIDYDKVVKLETFKEDASEIVMKKLAPTSRGLYSQANKVSGGARSFTTEKYSPPEYGNLSTQNLGHLIKLFGKDLDMFGFSWYHSDLEQSGISLSCHKGALNRTCC